jgi:hypothetical protein
MPNGLLIPLSVNRNATLLDIKEVSIIISGTETLKNPRFWRVPGTGSGQNPKFEKKKKGFLNRFLGTLNFEKGSVPLKIFIVWLYTFLFSQELFEEASKFPLNWALQDRSTYVFLCIIPGGCKIEHVSDESKRLLEVNPFRGILRLQEKKSEKPDDRIENSIQKLIGRGIRLLTCFSK